MLMRPGERRGRGDLGWAGVTDTKQEEWQYNGRSVHRIRVSHL